MQEEKTQLLFQHSGKMTFFGFEFGEGQEKTAFVFYFFAFDELFAKIAYHFIHDMAGESSSCAQSRVFCAAEKWGKGIVSGHLTGPTTDLQQIHSHD
jgi:hypothetical protein